MGTGRWRIYSGDQVKAAGPGGMTSATWNDAIDLVKKESRSDGSKVDSPPPGEYSKQRVLAPDARAEAWPTWRNVAVGRAGGRPQFMYLWMPVKRHGCICHARLIEW